MRSMTQDISEPFTLQSLALSSPFFIFFYFILFTSSHVRKFKKKHTRADNVFIWMYKTVSSLGKLSVTEVAYKWNQVY